MTYHAKSAKNLSIRNPCPPKNRNYSIEQILDNTYKITGDYGIDENNMIYLSKCIYKRYEIAKINYNDIMHQYDILDRKNLTITKKIRNDMVNQLKIDAWNYNNHMDVIRIHYRYFLKNYEIMKKMYCNKTNIYDICKELDRLLHELKLIDENFILVKSL